MRKSIVMGLGMALAFRATAAAQQPAPGRDTTGRPKAEHGRFDRRGGPPQGFMLRGITLTEAQKTQLKQLRESEHQKMPSTREGDRAEMAKAREARQRGDTAAARAIAQRHRQAMEQTRAQHVAAVRNILTAEQRVQFDKNVAELAQQKKERGDRYGPRKGGVGRGARGGRAGFGGGR